MAETLRAGAQVVTLAVDSGLRHLTPLAAVLGHLEMLVESDDLPPGIQQQLQVIERNAHRLESLVSDLLQLAQGR